jgi:hypothetical protein
MRSLRSLADELVLALGKRREGCRAREIVVCFAEVDLPSLHPRRALPPLDPSILRQSSYRL